MEEQKIVEKYNLMWNRLFFEEFFSNPEFMDFARNFSAERSDYTKGANFLPTTLKPRFNTLKQEELIRESTENIISALKKIEQELVKGNKELQDFMGLNENQMEVLKFPCRYKNSYFWVRFDCALEDLSLKVLEINLNFPGGPGFLDEIYENFAKLSIIDKFSKFTEIKPNYGLNEIFYQTALKNYKEAGFEENKPNIIILKMDELGYAMDSESVKKYFEKNGHKVVIVDPSRVKYDGKYLIYGDHKANLILKWFDIDDLFKKKGKCKDFYKALKDNSLALMNPLSIGVVAAKSTFAVMTSEKYAYLFSDQEKSSINKCILWTRIFGNYDSEDKLGKKINLLKYAKENKDEIVLKPSVGTGGEKVFVGVSYTEKEWNKIINDIIKEKRNYIIQDRVEIISEYFPNIHNDSLIFEKRRIDLLPYIMDEKYFCSGSRCASGYILNVKDGAIGGINYTILNNQ